MNTNPAETDLALWLEDELHGESLAAFEAGEGRQAHHLAARAEVRRIKAMVASTFPACEEPPYPDFFNSRVMRAIRQPEMQPAVVAKRRGFFQHPAFMPLAACAGMVLAFGLGLRSHRGVERDGQAAGAVHQVNVAEPFVYTPESGVRVERFASSDASATVIVLDGVAAIPDAMDFSKYTSPDDTGESSSTAETEVPGTDSTSL